MLNFNNLEKGTKYILFITVGIYLFVELILGFFSNTLYQSTYIFMSLIPDLAIDKFYIWQFATHLFMHAPLKGLGIIHILFNMLIFTSIGNILEKTWGTKKFVIFYLVSGILTGVISAFFYKLFINRPVSMIGASGSIMALLMAFSRNYPENTLKLALFGIIPLPPFKAKNLPFVLIGFEIIIILLTQRSTLTGGVSHVAHFSGLIIGFILYNFYIEEKAKKQKPIKFEYQFFINQCIYKLKNEISFSEVEINKLNLMCNKINENPIVLCNEMDFIPNSAKCLKCNKLACCIIREAKRKNLIY